MKKIKSERWIIFFILYILFTAACSCESYISGSPNFGDTGLVSNICGCLDFFSSYDGEIAYQASENK